MTAEWRGPFWLKPFVGTAGDTIFHHVTSVELNRRKVPDAVLKLPYLESLSLHTCQLSKAQLQRLQVRNALKSLALHDHYVADEAPPRLAEQPRTQAWLEFDPTLVPDWTLTSCDETSMLAYACPTAAPATD